MELNLPKRFVLFDTEFTAWEGSLENDWERPGEYRELVQIGAIRIDGETLEELDCFSVYIKPVRNPTLSDYFTNLTRITQEKIDEEGVDFRTAAQMFREWIGDDPCYPWGSDAEVLEENAELHGAESPFKGMEFIVMRDLFKNAGIDTENYSSGTITKAFGREPSFPAHNAVNDVRVVLEGLRLLKHRPYHKSHS